MSYSSEEMKKAQPKLAITTKRNARAEDVTRTLAARAQQERKRRNWTIQDLADRSGISRAMISKIERLDCSPTAVTLSRLSGAFGLSMSELFSSGKSNDRRLSRHKEQQIWQDPKTGYTRRTVSPLSGMPLQLIEVCLPAGAKVRFSAAAFSTVHQQIWMLEGRLTFTEGTERYRLGPGDCLQLAGAHDFEFENASRFACRYVVALIAGN